MPGDVPYQRSLEALAVALDVPLVPLVLGRRMSARTAQMKAKAQPMPNAGVLPFPKAFSIGPAVSTIIS